MGDGRPRAPLTLDDWCGLREERQAVKREPLIVQVPTALALAEASKLTPTQRDLLDNMADAPRRGWDGIIPHGSGQQRAMQVLVHRGLARYVGEAECGECAHETATAAYELTDGGRAVLAALTPTESLPVERKP